MQALLHNGDTLEMDTTRIACFWSAVPQQNQQIMDQLGTQRVKTNPDQDGQLFETANPIKAVLLEDGQVENLVDMTDDDSSGTQDAGSDSATSRSQHSECTITESCVMDTETAVCSADLLKKKTEIQQSGRSAWMSSSGCKLLLQCMTSPVS